MWWHVKLGISQFPQPMIHHYLVLPMRAYASYSVSPPQNETSRKNNTFSSTISSHKWHIISCQSPVHPCLISFFSSYRIFPLCNAMWQDLQFRLKQVMHEKQTLQPNFIQRKLWPKCGCSNSNWSIVILPPSYDAFENDQVDAFVNDQVMGNTLDAIFTGKVLGNMTNTEQQSLV